MATTKKHYLAQYVETFIETGGKVPHGTFAGTTAHALRSRKSYGDLLVIAKVRGLVGEEQWAKVCLRGERADAFGKLLLDLFNQVTGDNWPQWHKRVNLYREGAFIHKNKHWLGHQAMLAVGNTADADEWLKCFPDAACLVTFEANERAEDDLRLDRGGDGAMGHKIRRSKTSSNDTFTHHSVDRENEFLRLLNAILGGLGKSKKEPEPDPEPLPAGDALANLVEFALNHDLGLLE